MADVSAGEVTGAVTGGSAGDLALESAGLIAPDELPTLVFAVRHGETAWNADGRIQGQLDIGLNDNGRWQAGRMAEALAGEGIAFVYSSDLQRALDTARPLAASNGAELITDTGLRERGFGVFEGQTFDQIAARWPEQSQRWRGRDPEFGAEGGETLQAFYDRCIGTMSRLAAAHPGEAVAFVAHGGVLDCLYRAATHIALNAPRTWQVGNASINRLLHTPRGFTLIGWSDTQHLDRPALDEASDGALAAAT